MYEPFVNNYDNSLVHVKNIRTKIPYFDELCTKNQHLTNNLTLQSLLIQPVQRLPRYKMLLEQLLKNTDRDHIDYSALEKALNKIGETVMIINEKKREHENNKVDKEVKSLMGTKAFWDLNLKNRKFILGKYLIMTKGSGKPIRSYVYFFADVVIIFTVKQSNILEKTFSFTKKDVKETNKEEKPNLNYESHFFLDPIDVTLEAATNEIIILRVADNTYTFQPEKQGTTVSDMSIVIQSIKICLANPPKFEEKEKQKKDQKIQRSGSFFGQSFLKPTIKDESKSNLQTLSSKASFKK